MTDLAETFGDEFAEQYEKERKNRMQEREQVDEKTLREIAKKARSSDGFSPEEPHFQYKSDTGITHDALLMTLPDLDDGTVFSRFMNQLDSGAVTCPLDYMGEWMSCLFNNEEDLTGMEPGKKYVIVGELDQWENDAGEMNDQVSPVRGVISLDQVKRWSDDAVEEEVNEPEPDMGEINEPDSSEDDDDSGSEETFDPDGSSGDDSSEEEEEEEDESPSIDLGSAVEDDEEDDEEDETELPEDDFAEELDLLVKHKQEIEDFDEDDQRWNDVAEYVAEEAEFELTEDNAQEVRDFCIDHVLGEEEEEDEEEEDDVEDSLFG